MPLVIRPAIFNDIPALNELIAASVRVLGKNYYTDAQIESSIKYVFGVDTQLLADGTYYVVESENRIAACGGWSKRNTLYGGDQHKSTADPLLDPAVDAARIRAFFVHPDFARQGIGKMLINYCENEAIKNGFTRIELGATLPGEPLYLAMGYKALYREECQMPDGQSMPVIKMYRDIK
jgi:GNAT superfamily N-acetyltransferase